MIKYENVKYIMEIQKNLYFCIQVNTHTECTLSKKRQNLTDG